METVRNLVLKHFLDPLKPLKSPELEGVRALVECPLKDPKSRGGLTPLGLQAFADDPEILKASALHKEQTRVKIHAVEGACLLFCKLKAGTASPLEKKALCDGIRITTPNGGVDHIKTTKKGGSLLTEDFKRMMSDAYQALKPESINRSMVIAKSAVLHKEQEQLERIKLEQVAEMA